MIMKNGLKQVSFLKRHDPRRFRYQKYAKKFGAFDINLLPKEGMGKLPTAIKSQKSLDFCAAFANASVREDQEKVLLSPFPTWAYAAYLRGDYKSWGMDLENIRKAACKFGFVEEEEAKDYNADMNRDFLAQLKNYPPELLEKAKKHKAQSGFWIEDNWAYDRFDDMRMALWQNKELSILTGVDFKFSWLNVPKGIIKDYNKTEQSFGHALKIYNFKEIDGEQYLVAQLSNGMIGDNGLMYFSRKVINSPLFRFGALMFIDENPNDIKKDWSIYVKILDTMIKVLELMFKQTEIKPIEVPPIPPIPAIPEPIEPIKISRIIDWAKAIKIYENSPKSWNNPGSIRGINGQFLKFNTYQEGFDYLCNYLTRTCKGEHKAYKPTMTLFEFFKVYAPSYDNNSPEKYALFVAEKLKVAITIQIKDLL